MPHLLWPVTRCSDYRRVKEWGLQVHLILDGLSLLSPTILKVREPRGMLKIPPKDRTLGGCARCAGCVCLLFCVLTYLRDACLQWEQVDWSSVPYILSPYAWETTSSAILTYIDVGNGNESSVVRTNLKNKLYLSVSFHLPTSKKGVLALFLL